MENNRNNVAEQIKDERVDLNRRRFFKASALGATLGVTSLVTQKGAMAATVAQKAATRECDDFPQRILASYRRFPQRNTIFSRAVGQKDPRLLKALKGKQSSELALMGKAPRALLEKEPGWTAEEKALEMACWSIENLIAHGSALGIPNTEAYAWEGLMSPIRHDFKDQADATKKIKKAAITLGASLVGITPYDERWTYAPLYHPIAGKDIPAEFPFRPKSVIVMALEMDYKRIETAPSWIATSTTAQQYSHMATVGYSVTTFLRQLGYRAFAAGNDVALSVPYGVAAGLGELGRNGILVTYEYGPRVRLCKIFTEIELDYDKPKTFGVREFCERCQRCADACPGKAISKDQEPGFRPRGKSNNPGVEKWYIDGEKCFDYWGESSSGCSTCIASCPYNKPDFWHHKMVVWLTKAAPGPLHSLMREMDIVFGYGNSFDKKALRQWWDKD